MNSTLPSSTSTSRIKGRTNFRPFCRDGFKLQKTLLPVRGLVLQGGFFTPYNAVQCNLTTDSRRRERSIKLVHHMV